MTFDDDVKLFGLLRRYSDEGEEAELEEQVKGHHKGLWRLRAIGPEAQRHKVQEVIYKCRGVGCHYEGK